MKHRWEEVQDPRITSGRYKVIQNNYLTVSYRCKVCRTVILIARRHGEKVKDYLKVNHNCSEVIASLVMDS